MAELAIETPEGVPLRFELAGLGARILAASIDVLLLSIGYIVLATVLQLTRLPAMNFILASAAIVSLVAYSFLFTWLFDGRTPGKVWAGLRVCDLSGFRASPGRIFLRSLFVPLEALLIVPVPVVWVVIALTPLRQRLGDLVAGTLVLRERAPRAPAEPAPGQTWSALEAKSFAFEPLQVRALGAADLAFLRGLLTRVDLEPEAGERLLLRAARLYATRLELGTRTFAVDEARTFLRELFLYLREVRAAKAPPAEAAGVRGRPRASAPDPR